MDGLNSLLIVASALSVFCQYIDTNHKSDIQTIKSNISKLDFSEADKNHGMAEVKKSWDDILNSRVSRANNYVVALFFYLASIVSFISIHNFQIAIEYIVIPSSPHYVVSIFGLILLFLFICIAMRIKGMWAEQVSLKNDANVLKKTHKAVRAAIQSQKANHQPKS